MNNWLIFRGDAEPHNGIDALPPPPNWRAFNGGPPHPAPPAVPDWSTARRLGHARAVGRHRSPRAVQMVNAALYLRRPLLVTGKPGVGKSALAYDVAHELQLGQVLTWPISSRSTLSDGLYQYDAIGRLGAENLRRAAEPDALEPDDTAIGRFLRLGPLGTALLPFERPRALLIDEIDKSDIDLPNDLLNVFEEGEYGITELQRLASQVSHVDVSTCDGSTAIITDGRVRCRAFPFIVMTSNDEREFPIAFLRRCLRLTLAEPDTDQIAAMVEAHLGPDIAVRARQMIDEFVHERSGPGVYASDQILSAVYLRFARGDVDADDAQIEAVRAVLGDLNGTGLASP